jgi:hypothetical protein
MRMYLREVGWKGVGWIHVVQDNNHWSGEYGSETLGSIKGREFLD